MIVEGKKWSIHLLQFQNLTALKFVSSNDFKPSRCLVLTAHSLGFENQLWANIIKKPKLKNVRSTDSLKNVSGSLRYKQTKNIDLNEMLKIT